MMNTQKHNAIFPPPKSASHHKTSCISFLKKKLFSKNVIGFFLLILIFVIIELLFDVIEIALGEIIDWTNPLRPTTGAVWTLEYKDENASRQLQTIIEEMPEKKPELMDIDSFDELNQILDEQEEVIIGKDNFLDIYTQLPREFAQEIMSPFDMIPLARGDTWVKTKIVKGENELRIYLMDAADQLIRDCYPSLSKYHKTMLIKGSHGLTLEQLDEFDGRVVSGDEFYQAFNSLPLSRKVYIMNDPFQLLKWGDSLKNVAISRYVVDGGVKIGFEVSISNGTLPEVHQYYASEIAVTYLINRINRLFPGKNLQMPERKEVEVNTP